MKGLEKDRTRRYESANLLALDVTRFLNDEVVSASPPDAIYRLQKFWRRHRLGILAASAVTVAFMIGLVLAIWQAVAADHARRQADAARQRSQRSLYFANVSLASEALRQNRLGRAVDLLADCEPQAGTDYRDWEWRYLWGASRGEEIATLPGQSQSVWDVTFSPDGRFFAAAIHDHSVAFWDAATNELVKRLEFESRVGAVAFDETGEYVALMAAAKGTGDPGKVHLWRVLDADAAGSVTLEEFDSFDATIGDVTWLERSAIAFTPNNDLLAIGQHDGEIVFRDYRRRKTRKRIQAQDKSINAIAFSPQGAMAAGGLGETLRIWELDHLLNDEPAIPLHELKVPVDSSDNRSSALAVFDLAFSQKGTLAASGSFRLGDVGIRVWNGQTGEVLKDIDAHRGWVGAIEFSTDGEELITAGAADQSIRIWDVHSWEENDVLKGHFDEIWAAAISPDGKKLVTGSRDREIKFWSVRSSENPEAARTFRRLANVIFSSDSKTFAAIDQDNLLRLWDAETIRETRNSPNETLQPNASRGRVALSAEWAAIGYRDRSIELWNLHTNRSRKIVRGCEPRSHGLCILRRWQSIRVYRLRPSRRHGSADGRRNDNPNSATGLTSIGAPIFSRWQLPGHQHSTTRAGSNLEP